MTAVVCDCDAGPGARLVDHRTTCPVFVYVQARLVEGVAFHRRRNEDRATGRRLFKTLPALLRWWIATRIAWSSVRGLPLDPEREGDGRPSRGFDDPRRRLAAAVLGALKAAEQDDRKRNTSRPAPLERWICLHFHGRGRCHSFSFEQISDEEEGRWTAVEIQRRLRRALSEMNKRLRAGGFIESCEEEDDSR